MRLFNQLQSTHGQMKSLAGSMRLVDPDAEAVRQLTASGKEVRRLWHGYCTFQKKLCFLLTRKVYDCMSLLSSITRLGLLSSKEFLCGCLHLK
jgi:hypothetical protein